jgi:3-oxoacyl-[acyl-carrier protein] reductase
MLNGKVAFVTGGSGALGRTIVRTLTREGARVAYSYKTGFEKARQLDEALAATGSIVQSYSLDVLDGKAAAKLAETIEQQLGPVDILVNSAGTTHVMPFALIEEKDWDLVMDVNVKGMFLVTKAFVRGMIRRKAGNIINIGSLGGTRMLEVPVHYAAAKSAVVGFTLALARELGRYNIRVNTVVPGLLTEGISVNVPTKQQEEYKNYCALSRAGTTQEVAELVAFLASDKSSYINAQAIAIDGGI